MILHITNDYAGSKVYKNLVQQLDLLGTEQLVYTPVKSEKSIGKNRITFQQESSEIIYSNILNTNLDRAFYRLKIKKILKDIESKVEFSKISMIHAHTWYSDGGVAYLLHKKYNIPYIITVRNSDINVFYKYLLHERSRGKKILKNAKKIIFISASHQKRVMNFSGFKKWVEKSVVIPNGVDSYWIENAVEEGQALRLRETIKLLYVGKFSSEKNVENLIDAVVRLKNIRQSEVILNIAGVGGDRERQVIALMDKYPEVVKYHGQINDKPTLLSLYRSCDAFVMPSNRETFGLVYVEAMLQGLPILYTKNEGIDGFYDENIGEMVEKGAKSDEILEKLQILLVNYKHYHLPIEKLKQNHTWKNIAEVYHKIYR